jgi:excisionase family DNA binding protein
MAKTYHWRRFVADYLKIPELARRLDVSEKTARRYVKGGALPSTFIGGAYRVTEEDLEKFLHRAEVRPEDASPKGRSPFSAERALTLADSDSVRREARGASVEQLQQASLELAHFTQLQTRENPSSREETHRRVIAHERLGIIEGELAERGAPSPVKLVVARFNDATSPGKKPPQQSHEGQEVQETA